MSPSAVTLIKGFAYFEQSIPNYQKNADEKCCEGGVNPRLNILDDVPTRCSAREGVKNMDLTRSNQHINVMTVFAALHAFGAQDVQILQARLGDNWQVCIRQSALSSLSLSTSGMSERDDKALRSSMTALKKSWLLGSTSIAPRSFDSARTKRCSGIVVG